MQLCVDYLKEYPLLVGACVALPLLLCLAFFFLMRSEEPKPRKSKKKKSKDKEENGEDSGKKKRLQRRKISSVGSTRLEKEISGGFAGRNEVKNVNAVKICYILFYILINLCISVMSVIQQQYNVMRLKPSLLAP